MVINDQDGCIELEMTEQIPLDSQGAGDTRFIVRVRFRSHETVFSAETWAWVEAPVLAAFASQLRALEEKRQGSAVMESMSPGELRLEIRIYDGAGHVGAFGQVGHWCHGGVGGPYWSVVTFGIPFCPTELPGLVHEFEVLSRSVVQG